MRRHLLDIVLLVVFASIATGYVLAEEPGIRTPVLHAYVLFVGGLVMLGVVAAAGDAVPRLHRSRFDVVLAEVQPEERRLSELERMEREVTLGAASSFDLHFRLLPDLREIARARLERVGKVPSPDTLGRWWELLAPDRPAPDDRFAKGISEAELRALVADLERL
ncbi:MAG TPA: hypothetical protein VLK36_08585 [Gaiellaceae bacterium]|nr:hypothetical protein [Gaiellaceae bacterium]